MSLQELIKRLPLNEVARIANDGRHKPFRVSCAYHVVTLNEREPGEIPHCIRCDQPVPDKQP